MKSAIVHRASQARDVASLTIEEHCTPHATIALVEKHSRFKAIG